MTGLGGRMTNSLGKIWFILVMKNVFLMRERILLAIHWFERIFPGRWLDLEAELPLLAQNPLPGKKFKYLSIHSRDWSQSNFSYKSVFYYEKKNHICYEKLKRTVKCSCDSLALHRGIIFVMKNLEYISQEKPKSYLT